MPAPQCPMCGRFLKQAFVRELSDAPAPCPRCEQPLTAADFDAAPAPPQTASSQEPDVPAHPEETATAERSAPAEPSAAPATGPASVRPPDLEPASVHDDVLAGWDRGIGPMPPGGWQRDEPPFPTDAVVVAGAAAAGVVLGAVGGRRRGRGALLGALAGAVLAGAARKVWRLDV